ncbi:MAG: tRNA uridine-5-carboxymethylaminomethyl(34) synthesis GTPase MnmE [Pseudomonadota bacterium]
MARRPHRAPSAERPFSDQAACARDVVEIHAHGSRAVADAILGAAVGAGARSAERGEYARRAVANGRIDLAEAEGLGDLIDAETESQRRQALAQMGGALSKTAEGWRERLLAAAVPLEAAIDFPDEGDVPSAIAERAAPEIDRLRNELSAAAETSRAARALRDGVSVVLIGAPNAGKSSIFNALVGHDAAIVTATPGTTRDVLEARLDLGGVLVRLADTAGLRDSDDAIEAEGVRRAEARAAEADVRVLVVDADDPKDVAGDADIIAMNKSDLARPPPPRADALFVSAATGEGMDALIAAIGGKAQEAVRTDDAPALSRRRHLEAVEDAVAALDRSMIALKTTPELAAEDVRLAARRLARITGAIDVEDVLDRIFAGFCIGK